MWAERWWSIAALALVSAAAACDAPAPARPDASTPAPAGLELAPSTSITEVDTALPAIDVGPAATADGPGAIERVRGARGRGFALVVDRRATFAAVRPVLADGLSTGTSAVELRVGRAGAVRAIEVCAAASPIDLSSPDCLGRRVTRPRDADAGSGPEAGPAPVGDIADRPPAFVWSAPLALELSVEPEFVVLRVQGRSLRTLEMGRPAGGAARPLRALLRQTLDTLRRNNRWDRRAAVRVADGVHWEGLVEILDVLVETEFDQIALVGVAAGPRP
jgi:hypothetical protein